MRIDGFHKDCAEMEAPGRFGKRDLQRIAHLARRIGREAKVYTWRPRLQPEPTRSLLMEYGDRAETLLLIESEWDGEQDGHSAVLLDLVEAAGFDTILYSNTANGGGYRAQATDDDGENIDTVAMCFGRTRTLAAAGLAIWAERKTRSRNGNPRFGPRRAA